MPAFFLPGLEDDSDFAEQTYAAIKKFAEEEHGWPVSDRRVFRIDYVHNGKDMYAQVGEPHPYGHPYSWEYVPDTDDPRGGEFVAAILESKNGFVRPPNIWSSPSVAGSTAWDERTALLQVLPTLLARVPRALERPDI